MRKRKDPEPDPYLCICTNTEIWDNLLKEEQSMTNTML